MQFKSLLKSINWSDDLLKAPNMLTLSRLLVLPFLLYFISLRTPTGTWIGFALLLLISATDILDGYIARHYHEKTNLGRLIDPVIDKICLDSIIVVLAFVSHLPIWYMVFLLIRDVSLIVGGTYLILKQQIMFESNWPGKLSFASNVLVIITFLFSIEPLQVIIIVLATVVVSIATINYFIAPFAEALGIRTYFQTGTFSINFNEKTQDAYKTR